MRVLKQASNEAVGETESEAYPLGYVEDFCELRTPLADFFSSLLARIIHDGSSRNR